MTLSITALSLPEILLVAPRAFGDHRGFFLETFHQRKYQEAGLDRTFVQDNHSRSQQFVLRGLHYQLQKPQGKLVYAVSGEIFDVAVDIRRGSPSFGYWVGTHLSDTNHHQLFIPEGFAHGFVVLSESANVVYKCTQFYEPGDEYGIYWADPGIGVHWPVDAPILSEKDEKLPNLTSAPDAHLPVYR